jgi:hypothetical protein
MSSGMGLQLLALTLSDVHGGRPQQVRWRVVSVVNGHVTVGRQCGPRADV